MEPDYSRKSTNLYWFFDCDCGKRVSIMGKSVRNGTTQSCGCSKHKNWTGKKVGLLTVLEKTEKRISRKNVWKCQCECGNIVYVDSGHLQKQDIISCGCQKISLGEIKIRDILNENHIEFVREKKFDNCRFPNTNCSAKFDFYVENKYLIEFDGIGHYQSVDYFGGKEAFIKQKEHDSYKNNWCKTQNIPLIRIPYTHLDDLTILDLQVETSHFVI